MVPNELSELHDGNETKKICIGIAAVVKNNQSFGLNTFLGTGALCQ